MTELELEEVEITFNGEDIAAIMVMSCQGIVSGLATLLNILHRRGILDNDPTMVKMREDYQEYLRWFEQALMIQLKLREMKEGPQEPSQVDIGYG
jgi:hypothetical protein